MVIGFLLFFVLGLTLGYAVRGPGAWAALLVPVAFAILTALGQGVDARLALVLIASLAITAAAIVAGRLLDRYVAARSGHSEGEQAS